MIEISAKKGLCEVIRGSEVKTSGLAAHFSRNSGAANTVLNVHRIMKDGKIKSTVYALIICIMVCGLDAYIFMLLSDIALSVLLLPC